MGRASVCPVNVQVKITAACCQRVTTHMVLLLSNHTLQKDAVWHTYRLYPDECTYQFFDGPTRSPTKVVNITKWVMYQCHIFVIKHSRDLSLAQLIDVFMNSLHTKFEVAVMCRTKVTVE